MTTRPAGRRTALALVTLITVGFSATGPATAGVAPAGPLRPELPPPGDFARRVDNPFFPLKPGTRWVYRGHGSEAGERIVVRVLDRTRLVAGIRATVVRDVVTEQGRVVEDTFDWYAQDRRGNVWYLGEATRAYDEDGTISTEGSWEAGVDGAEAGIQMWADPHVGRSYFQEYDAGNAEDVGEVLRTGVRVVSADKAYDDARLTMDSTPLEKDVTELKFYAPGVGTVLTLDVSPAEGRTELVRVTHR